MTGNKNPNKHILVSKLYMPFKLRYVSAVRVRHGRINIHIYIYIYIDELAYKLS